MGPKAAGGEATDSGKCRDHCCNSNRSLQYREHHCKISGMRNVCRNYRTNWKIWYWLGFLDTYRTLCVAPNQEIRSIFDELRSFSSSSCVSLQSASCSEV